MAEKKKRDFEKIIRRRLSVVKMGVHTQGESGFFDDDPDELPAMVQNESIEQHETANATVGKCHMFPTHTHTTHKSTWPKKKKRKLWVSILRTVDVVFFIRKKMRHKFKKK